METGRKIDMIQISKGTKWLWLLVLCGIAGWIYFYRGDLVGFFLTLSKGSIDDVVSLIQSWGVFAPLFSILLMIIQAVAFPLPSFLVTLANGIVFGIFWGAFISWVGAMAGAVVAFLLARILGEKFVRKRYKNEKSWNKIDQISGKYGFRVVLIARLLPFVSFDFISYAAGLSRMKIGIFLISTGIGMLPATIVYSTVGNEIHKLSAYNDKFFTYSMAIVVVVILVYTIRAFINFRKKADQHQPK